MKKSIIVFSIIFFLVGLGARAAPNCMRPNVTDFLQQSRAAIRFTGSYFPMPTANFLPFSLNEHSLQWMAASWEAPADGALFVLNCNGAELAALRLGQIERLQRGPVISGFGQTFEVIYAPGVATGDQSYRVNLVAFSAGSIHVLWAHKASQLVNVPSPPTNYTDTYTWHYSNGGASIKVSGIRAVGEFPDHEHDWRPGTTLLFPNEIFCWRKRQLIYALCTYD